MATTAPKPRTTRKPSSETPEERSDAVANEPRDDKGRFAREKATAAKPRAAAKPRTSSAGKKSDQGSSTGTLIGVAAAGLAVGLAANVARKFAVQAPTALAGDWDVALAAEHQATLKIFETLQLTTEKNIVKRGTLLAQLKHALSKHAMEEENVIYPALREAGEIEAADSLNKDHGYVKQYLYELTEMPKDSIEFLPKLHKFRADLEKHIREEEGDLFSRLKLKLSAEKNKELTSAMNKEGLKLA